MSNDYFNHDVNRLASDTLARSDAVNALFDAIAVGFNRLPTLQRLRGGAITYATDAGTGGNFVLTLDGVSTPFEGLRVVWKVAAANAGACTVKINTAAAQPFVQADGTDFQAGYFASGQITEAVYDGTVFRALR